jgi:hypothetical protein
MIYKELCNPEPEVCVIHYAARRVVDQSYMVPSYFRAKYIGPVLAAEMAEAYYRNARFELRKLGGVPWLFTDLSGSGRIPTDYIKAIKASVWLTTGERTPDDLDGHAYYESLAENLLRFLEFKHCQGLSLELNIMVEQVQWLQRLRKVLIPVLYQLKAAGVQLDILFPKMWGSYPVLDFDLSRPLEEWLKLFEKEKITVSITSSAI